MGTDFLLLTGLLALVWFLVYWVVGGVALALLAVLRFGRLRKVRFSCLLTLLALVTGVGAAYGGVRFSEEAVVACVDQVENKAQAVSAIFGCGFVGIMGGFTLGLGAVLVGGFFLLLLCRRPIPRLGDEDASAPVAPPPDHFETTFLS